MSDRRVLAVFLCLVIGLYSSPGWTSSLSRPRSNVMIGADPSDDSEPLPLPFGEFVRMSENPEIFRGQLVKFADEMQEVLDLALEQPVLRHDSSGITTVLRDAHVQLAEARAAMVELGHEDLAEVREHLEQLPGFLSIPGLAKEGIERTVAGLRSATDPESCPGGENLDEVVFVLKIVIHALTHVGIVAGFADQTISAAPDPTHVAFVARIPFILIKFLTDATINILQTTITITDRVQAKRDECIASLCSLDENPTGRGKGCDGRDNDCDDGNESADPPSPCTGPECGIDELDEDMFPPDVAINRGVALRCYPSESAATDAVLRFTEASDDCSSFTTESGSEVAGCDIFASASAIDESGNAGSDFVQLVLDGTAPAVSIAPEVANTCYSSLEAGELAIRNAAAIADDCTASGDIVTTISSSVSTCSLRVLVEAEDLCGNRSDASATVRVDTGLPGVRVERQLLADRGGLACFATREEAEAAVFDATRFSDDCTPTESLTRAGTSSGDDCNLTVTSTATDECGNSNSDSFGVRADAEPPSVSCGLAMTELTPSNGEMIDVGFSFASNDNCDANPEIEVSVTSDEPTSTDSGPHGPHSTPDAVILRDGNMAVEGILLRAQSSPQGDGRVYRIRVHSTDACGLISQADCLVSVPRNPPHQAINSGQFFDATAVN